MYFLVSQVYLPSGVTVQIWRGRWGFNVYVVAPKPYNDGQVEGLCGNYDGKAEFSSNFWFFWGIWDSNLIANWTQFGEKWRLVNVFCTYFY